MIDNLNLTHDELAALVAKDPVVAQEYVQTRDDINELGRKQVARVDYIRQVILATKTAQRLQTNLKKSSGSTEAVTIHGHQGSVTILPKGSK